MGLRTTDVYRCLEKKTLVFGFEMLDLFFVFLTLAFLNLLFKEMPFKFFLTWGPAILLAGFLRIAKQGKPDNYLLHWIRAKTAKPILSAFPLAKKRTSFSKRGLK